MSIASALSGGDPRSLGRTEEVVARVLVHRQLLSELFECVFSEDEIVRMRAGDALEKICAQKPAWLKPYLGRLLDEVSQIDQPSVQWHLAQMFSELELDEEQKRQAIAIMKNNLKKSDDWIVTNLTLESLADFVRRGDLPKSELLKIARKYKNSRHKSVARRAEKLIKEFAREGSISPSKT